MMPDSNLRIYPATCPACGKVEGNPVRVATVKEDHYKLVIHLCCRACDHRWDDVVQTDA